MGLSRRALARAPGIGFRKLLGSGVGEGFTPRPNTAVWAILAEWPDAARAREATSRDRPFSAWAAHADETFHLFLAPFSRRGRWSGAAPFEPGATVPIKPATPGPIAAITRATLRPRTLLRFWGREPAISAAIGANPDVLLKIGLGEVPWLQQVTFSIWPDAAAMDRFARAGPHAGAIAAARKHGWFAEELYARFAVIGRVGTWEGRDPLLHLPTPQPQHPQPQHPQPQHPQQGEAA